VVAEEWCVCGWVGGIPFNAMVSVAVEPRCRPFHEPCEAVVRRRFVLEHVEEGLQKVEHALSVPPLEVVKDVPVVMTTGARVSVVPTVRVTTAIVIVVVTTTRVFRYTHQL
jgi:hypothetical protein